MRLYCDKSTVVHLFLDRSSGPTYPAASFPHAEAMARRGCISLAKFGVGASSSSANWVGWVVCHRMSSWKCCHVDTKLLLFLSCSISKLHTSCCSNCTLRDNDASRTGNHDSETLHAGSTNGSMDLNLYSITEFEVWLMLGTSSHLLVV